MINLGIVGCSEIAFRRFMPAVQAVKDINVVAVAEEYDTSKLEQFCNNYKLEGMTSFSELIARDDIDAVYVPQPPALHHRWAKEALEHGKHVLLEKPSTTEFMKTSELVDLAQKRDLALHENYMFQYHSQIQNIIDLVKDGKIGEIRMIRENFGFPMRANNDFRYVKALGGGALMDAAGYPIKLATMLLGESIKVDTAHMAYLPDYEVDMYGSATLSNKDGVICQIGYGMDCSYQCNLDIWGSKGRIYTDRIFTAPPEYNPKVLIEVNGQTEEIVLEEDSHFQHSIEQFVHEVNNSESRSKMYRSILLQAKLIEDIRG